MTQWLTHISVTPTTNYAVQTHDTVRYLQFFIGILSAQIYFFCSYRKLYRDFGIQYGTIDYIFRGPQNLPSHTYDTCIMNSAGCMRHKGTVCPTIVSFMHPHETYLYLNLLHDDSMHSAVLVATVSNEDDLLFDCIGLTGKEGYLLGVNFPT